MKQDKGAKVQKEGERERTKCLLLKMNRQWCLWLKISLLVGWDVACYYVLATVYVCIRHVAVCLPCLFFLQNKRVTVNKFGDICTSAVTNYVTVSEFFLVLFSCCFCAVCVFVFLC